MSAQALRDTSIIAIVVWYEPQVSFPGNICSYASNVDHVVVIDNSANDNGAMLSGIENLTYIPMGRNVGIAAALNRGVEEAAALGAAWILTMDQDSRFEADELEALIATALSLHDDKSVAAVGSITDQKTEKDFQFNEVDRIITSGSLNRISSIQAIGGFDEKLFIDCVDFDFCSRLREAGFKVIMDKSSALNHRRGAPSFVTWRGRKYTTYNYDATRYYYQVRNNLYMGHRFPGYRKSSRKKVRRIIRNALLFERYKLHNLGAITQGIWHFILGRYGPRP